MSINLISEIWQVLKPSIEIGDSSEAAETLVTYMVDEEYSVEEIKKAFRGDRDIKKALSFYLETPDGGFSSSMDDLYEEGYGYGDDEYDSDY